MFARAHTRSPSRTDRSCSRPTGGARSRSRESRCRGWRGPGSRGIPRLAGTSSSPTAAVCVTGIEDVFAAGDAHCISVKQGGLAATRPSRRGCRAIACLAGADVAAEPFRPVLRGRDPHGRSAALCAGGLSRAGFPRPVATDALWWPPGKIVGSTPRALPRRALGCDPRSAGAIRVASRSTPTCPRSRRQIKRSFRGDDAKARRLCPRPSRSTSTASRNDSRPAAEATRSSTARPGSSSACTSSRRPRRTASHPTITTRFYVVLEGQRRARGRGRERRASPEGHAVFVPAGAEHRFVGYEQLSVPRDLREGGDEPAVDNDADAAGGRAAADRRVLAGRELPLGRARSTCSTTRCCASRCGPSTSSRDCSATSGPTPA